MGLLDGIFGGGGGKGGGILGGLPLVGGLFGGPNETGPTTSPQMPGQMLPGGWGGFPVPLVSPAVTPGNMKFEGDFSKPGQAESYFANWDPGAQGHSSSEYWEGVKGRGQTNPPKSTNYAKDAYESAQGLSSDTSPFYDRAARDATTDINRSLAAKGQFGSTAGTKRVSDAVSGIRSQQAQADAGYGLQRGGLLGNLAAGADASSSRGINNELGWLTGLGGLAQGVDASELARIMAGFNMAQGAQGAQRMRGQDFFNNQFQLGQAQIAPMLAMYQAMIGADQDLMNNQIQAYLGYPAQALAQGQTDKASTEAGLGNAAGIAGGISGAGGTRKILGGLL